MNAVVFTGDDSPGFLRVIFHQHAVDGLEGKHIDNRRVHAILLQLARRLQRLGNHNAVGNQRDIAAFTQNIPFTDGERRSWSINARGLFADGSNPVKTLKIDKLAQNILKHDGIGHFQHDRMRQPAHNAHIFKRHMGAAVMAGSHAGIRRDHLDVVALVIKRHKQLIKTATAGKGGEGMDKRFASGER